MEKKQTELERMNSLAQAIKDGFDNGKDDKEMSKDLGISELQVGVIRSMLGLRYRWAINVFEESRTLSKNNQNENFVVQFSIPQTVFDKLGIDFNEDYHYIASVQAKKQIVLNIMRK